MRYSHRFFLYAPVAAVVALAIALSAYWYSASSAFARKLEALNGHRIAPGVTFAYDYKTIGGFPFRVDAVLQNLRLTLATGNGPVEWRAQHFALHMLDYGRMHLIFEAAGRQQISWHDATGAAQAIAFTPALLRASALGRDGHVDRVDVELYDAASRLFRVAHTELHLRQDPKQNAFDIVFTAQRLHLPAASTPDIAKLDLRALLAPAKAWEAFLAGGAGWRQAAKAWQAQGGALDVAALDIDWGRVEANGKGVLSLDAAERPKGLVRFAVAGTPAAVKPSSIQGAGLLSALLAQAKQAEDGHSVTLALKDGLAYVNSTPAGFLAPVY